MNLGDQIINKISGPVRYTYLHPPEDHPEWPIVLLFGDHHFSREKMCYDCEEEDGCYKIYDKNFLKKIDKLAINYPIDFYTESPNLPEEKEMKFLGENKENVLFYNMLHTVDGCFNVSKRFTDDYDCPTQYIRWHHADARHMGRGIESYLGNFRRYLNFIPIILNLTKNLEQPYFMSLKKMLDVIYNQVFHSEIGEEASTFMKIFLDDLCSDRVDDQKLVSDLYDYIESNPDSLIFKQYKKLDPFLKEQNWKKIMYEQLLHIDFSTYGKTFLEEKALFDNEFSSNTKQIFKNLLKKGFTYKDRSKEEEYIHIKKDQINSFEEFVKKIMTMMTLVQASILNTYMIMRMFKTLKDDDRSILTIGFLGSVHSDIIAKVLLSEPFHYVLKNDSGRPYRIFGSASRCLSFQEIDLFNDMNELAERRYQIEPERIKKYRKKIGLSFNSRKTKKSHKKSYKKPRKMSKSYCKKTPCKKMGFSQRASCRPYKNCYKSKKK